MNKKLMRWMSKILIMMIVLTSFQTPMMVFAESEFYRVHVIDKLSDFKRLQEQEKYNEVRDEREILVLFKDIQDLDYEQVKDYSFTDTLKQISEDLNTEIGIVEDYSNVKVISVSEGTDLSDVIDALMLDAVVEHAQANLKVKKQGLFSEDSESGSNWGLENNGQEVNGVTGIAGADINLSGDYTGKGVVIGVLDTGIDLDHELVKNNIYKNPLEVPGNHIDDDGNGYKDDIYGWNFYNDSDDLEAKRGYDDHGTHISSIITSVSPDVQLIPLKFMHGEEGYTSDVIAAIKYAESRGIKIINVSFGNDDNNVILKNVMENSGILFITGAGNDGADLNASPVYPACFDLDNLVSVGAFNALGEISDFSNTGADVYAPGSNIFGAKVDGTAYMNGTSQAAAFTTGVAALLLEKYPDMTAEELALRLKVSEMLDATASLNTTVEVGRSLAPELKEETVLLEDKKMKAFAATIPEKLLEMIHFGEDGVNVATGNFSRKYTDQTVDSPGFTVSFSRTYNSKDERTSPIMGRGWTFGFEGSLKPDDANANLMVAKLPNGSAQVFLKSGDTYTANDSRSSLKKNSDGSHELTTSDQYVYGYNAEGYLVWMQDRNKNKLHLTVDSTGKVTKVTDVVGREYVMTYSNNLLTQITLPENKTIRYEYNDKNLLTKVFDPSGRVDVYKYDSSDYLYQIVENDTSVAEDEIILETITYDHSSGEEIHKVLQHTDILNRVVKYTYDKTNRITTLEELKDGSVDRTIKKYFDPQMYVIKSVDPINRETLIEYYKDTNGVNRFGEEKYIIDRFGNKTSFERDDRGNITKIINPDTTFTTYVYDSKNNLIEEVDESGNKTYYVYDSDQLRLLKVVKPINGTDKYDIYADQSKFVINSYEYYQAFENEQYGYSAKGLIKASIDAHGNRTTFTYDAHGNKKTVTDPMGHTTSYAYNGLGWLLKQTDAMNHVTEFVYDDSGLLVKVINNKDIISRKVYDDEGRLIKVIDPNAYNNAADSMVTGEFSYNYSEGLINNYYYKSGLLKKSVNDLGEETSYDYDIYGNLRSKTYPNGSIESYEYDLIHRLTKTKFQKNSEAEPELVQEIVYEVLDNGHYNTLVKDVLSKDSEGEYVYNTLTKEYNFRDDLVRITREDGANQTTVYNYNGTVHSTTDYNGATTYYVYDGLSRLVETWSPITPGEYSYKKYTYDKLGNVLEEAVSKDKVALHVRPSADRLIKSEMTYDNNGNNTVVKTDTGSTTRYEYNDLDQVIATYTYQDDNTVRKTTLAYDAYGQVIERSVHAKKGDFYGYDDDDKNEIVLTAKYEYDKNGNLTKETDYTGHETEMAYDVLNRKKTTTQQVENEHNIKVKVTSTTTYDNMGRVSEVEDILGNKIVNVYDEKGNILLKKTIPAGAESTPEKHLISAFSYDLAGRVTHEVSPNNFDAVIYEESKDLSKMNHMVYAYDNLNRLIIKKDVFKVSDSEWNEIVSMAYGYDINSNVIKEVSGEAYKNASGSTVEAKIRSAVGTRYTYNLAGLVSTMTTPDLVLKRQAYSVKYGYDGLMRKISETDANGAVTHYYYDANSNVTTITRRRSIHEPEYTLTKKFYDLDNNLVKEVDGNGNETIYAYNSIGRLKTTILPSDDSIGSAVSTVKYDQALNIKEIKDPNKITVFNYDMNKRKTGEVVTDLKGKKLLENKVKYDIAGREKFIINAKGHMVEKVYDEFSRLLETRTTSTALSGKTYNHVVSTTYDKNSNVLTSSKHVYKVDPNDANNTLETKNTTTSTYDALNRLIKITDANGSVLEERKYNDDHAEIKKILTKDGAEKVEVQYIYDVNGRVTAEINEAGHMKRTEYDLVGNVKTTEDGNRNVTTFSYDFYNRLVSVENAKGDITRYAYDMNGNRVSITNGRGHTTTMEYNDRNLVVKRIDHGGRTGEAGKYVYDASKTVVYDYNPDGTVKSMLDRNGVTTAYTYDTLSRVIKTVAGSEVITMTYDELGNQLTVTNSTGTITRNYDELGRVLTKATDTSGTMIFKYDQNDGLADGYTAEIMIDAKGHESKQIFDKLGRLTSVIADGKKTDYAYYDNGNKKSVTYYNKAGETYNKISSTEFTYTDDNQVKTMVNKNATDIVLNNYSYSYDSNGNQISKTDEKGTTTYTYDVLNRIASIKEPGGKTTYYSYDPAGNRWKERIIEGASDITKYYIYNEQNRLESISEFSDEDERESTVFKYDNNGNQLYSMKESLKKSSESETPKFGMFISGQDAYTEHAEELFRSETINRYNELNQLIETTTGPSTIKNTYNGEGLRVSKTVNNKETNYVYVYDKVILELDAYGNETARNVYGHNLASRTITNDSGVEESYMYLYNGHSDVVALLTSSGSVRVSYYYDAFGNVLEKDLKGLSDISNPFGYSGYQYDEETKTYYLNARMYDPFTARFLQEDTYRGRVTDPLSLNLYTYVYNNPSKYYDPSGHDGVKISNGGGTSNGLYGSYSAEDLLIALKIQGDRWTNFSDGSGTWTEEQEKAHETANKIREVLKERNKEVNNKYISALVDAKGTKKAYVDEIVENNEQPVKQKVEVTYDSAIDSLNKVYKPTVVLTKDSDSITARKIECNRSQLSKDDKALVIALEELYSTTGPTKPLYGNDDYINFGLRDAIIRQLNELEEEYGIKLHNYDIMSNDVTYDLNQISVRTYSLKMLRDEHAKDAQFSMLISSIPGVGNVLGPAMNYALKNEQEGSYSFNDAANETISYAISRNNETISNNLTVTDAIESADEINQAVSYRMDGVTIKENDSIVTLQVVSNQGLTVVTYEYFVVNGEVVEKLVHRPSGSMPNPAYDARKQREWKAKGYK